MDQDATWYGGRPQHRHIVLHGDPASPWKRGTAASQFSAHVCCGQTAGWTKMQLGMEVGLGPGDIVLDGDPTPSLSRKETQHPPLFGLCLLWPNGRPYELLWKFDFSVTCRPSWQDFNWLRASRGPSAITEGLVHVLMLAQLCVVLALSRVELPCLVLAQSQALWCQTINFYGHCSSTLFVHLPATRAVAECAFTVDLFACIKHELETVCCYSILAKWNGHMKLYVDNVSWYLCLHSWQCLSHMHIQCLSLVFSQPNPKCLKFKF